MASRIKLLILALAVLLALPQCAAYTQEADKKPAAARPAPEAAKPEAAPTLSRRTSPVPHPMRRAISPGWGVRMTGAAARPRVEESSTSAFSPSASTSIGIRNEATRPRTIPAVSGQRERPGPISATSKRPDARDNSSPAPFPRAPPGVSGSGSVIASVSFAAMTGTSERGAATVTRPAPERSAPAAARHAAPAIPVEPATMSRWP